MTPRPGSRRALWTRTRCPVRISIPCRVASSERPAMMGPSSDSRRNSCWGNSATTVASMVGCGCCMRSSPLGVGSAQMCRLPPLRTRDSRRNFSASAGEFNPNGEVFAQLARVCRCAVESARHRQPLSDSTGECHLRCVADPRSHEAERSPHSAHRRASTRAPSGAVSRRRPGAHMFGRGPPGEARISRCWSPSRPDPPHSPGPATPGGSRQREDPLHVAPRAWAVHR